MCRERRAPHSVTRTATSHDRGVSVGDSRQYQPHLQHEARAPADVRDTGIPQLHAERPHEGQSRQERAQTDERRIMPVSGSRCRCARS